MQGVYLIYMRMRERFILSIFQRDKIIYTEYYNDNFRWKNKYLTIYLIIN